MTCIEAPAGAVALIVIALVAWLAIAIYLYRIWRVRP